MGASDKDNPGSEVTSKFSNSVEGTVNAKLTAILNAIVYQAGTSKTPVKDVNDNLGDTENKTLLAILNAFVSFNDWFISYIAIIEFISIFSGKY